jgi:hypothetical protein
MDDRPPYWFAAKRYRWGWRAPLTWEGWLVDAIWFTTFVGISSYVQERQHGNSLSADCVAVTSVRAPDAAAARS